MLDKNSNGDVKHYHHIHWLTPNRIKTLYKSCACNKFIYPSFQQPCNQMDIDTSQQFLDHGLEINSTKLDGEVALRLEIQFYI